MNILFENKDVIVCEKPVNVLSEENEKYANMPALIREHLGDKNHYIGVVHRLDREVGGLMVYAKNENAAAFLSRQVSYRSFKKEYLAVVQGVPEEKEGQYVDLLFKDSKKNKSYVVKRMRKGVKEASLNYRVIKTAEDLSLVWIKLNTGRTHQIRVQFASRKMPLLSDLKYGGEKKECSISLWSYRLSFILPDTKEEKEFELLPKLQYPWELFK